MIAALAQRLLFSKASTTVHHHHHHPHRWRTATATAAQRRTLAVPTRWYTLEEAVDALRGAGERRRLDDDRGGSSFQARFHLNIDPRTIDGHNLRGVVHLPHRAVGGDAGRRRKVLALTYDPDLAQAALDAGAHRAGNLLKELRTRAVSLKEYDVVVACTDMKKVLAAQKGSVPRILAKFNLAPAAETGTLVKPPDFGDAVERYASGTAVQWRADRHGNVTVPLGRISLPTRHVVENCHGVLRELYRVRPPDFGAGGRPKNAGKYVLGVMLQTTAQGPARPIDLSTVSACEHCGRGPPPYYTATGRPHGVSFREPPTTAEGEGAAAMEPPRVPVLPNGHPVEPIVIRKAAGNGDRVKSKTNKKKNAISK